MTKTKIAQPAEPQGVGYFETVMLVRKQVPIVRGPYGSSLGAALDSHLAEMARDGNEVQSVTVNIDEDYWEALRIEAQSAEATPCY